MPYNYLTINEEDLIYGIVSASYFPANLQSLYEQKIVNEQKFFGDNGDDILELTVYNSNQEPIIFNRVIPKVTYSVVQGSYRDINNIPKNYDVKNPFTNYALYDNNLLLHTQFDLKINELTPGLYYTLYNPIRNIAGNTKNKLFIKEISPSRTEIRLSFAFNTNANEESKLDAFKITTFADKKYAFLQIIDEVISIIDNNPIFKTYTEQSNNYNYVKYTQLLGLKTTAQLQSFINDTYIGYNKTINLSSTEDSVINEISSFVGVNEQLKNFVYTYNRLEFTDSEIREAFRLIVAKVSQDAILQKTTLIESDLIELTQLFVDIIYTNWLLPKIDELLLSYNNKFYGIYKNAINFDNGNLVQILDHTSYLNVVDNTRNIQIKLDSPLPTQYSVKDTCWISNISLAPIYFKTNLYLNPISRKVYLNGVNFNVVTPTVNPTNDEFKGVNENTLFAVQSRLKNNINDLLIDYSDFSNFINFSSAELRTKIAKNKITQYNNIFNEKNSIKIKANNTDNTFISSSYATEFNKFTEQQILLLNTFDDYESYLFYNTSSINVNLESAVVYDSNNYNSLFYQIPEYLKNDSNNEDYIKFTAMVGHFFDNILVFIKKFPKTFPISYNDNNSYPKNYIDELLNSFGWDVTNVNFNKSRISQLLFNNTEFTGSLSSSYFDYAKSIFNRLTNNLNHVYKTKGTSTSFDLIRTIFGIPSDLINAVEYTSPDVLVNKDVFYDYNDIIYATKFENNQYLNFNFTSSEYEYTFSQDSLSASYTGSYKGDNIYLTRSFIENFKGISTFEMSFRLNDWKNYDFKEKIPLVKKLRKNRVDWQVYLYKTKQKESAKLVFEMTPNESGITSSISSIEMPYLNGNFYTFMLKKEPVDYIRYDSLEPSSSNTKIIGYYTNYEVTQSINNVYYPNSYVYVPHVYTLSVNQYYGSQLNFTDKQSKTIFYNQNKYFSSGSYYVGNFSSSINFVGNIDKIKVQKYALSDADFQEHSYNLNSISIPEKALTYENMYYLWSFDTPVNLYGTPYATINNQNNYYLNNFRTYNFNRNSANRGYPYCDTVSTDIFPYQFEKFNIKQAINSNKYGPNYKSNANINKITQNIDSNLVPYEYSTYTKDILGSDSNLIGYYISPYSYLNNKIEDFLGKEGITDVIGDPKYLTSRNYPELIIRQKEFAKTGLKYVYPQEFYSTYKFYIDFSIFDFIKKLSPSRSTLKRGLLLEPSIFERKKFNYKDVSFKVTDPTFNSSSLIQFNINGRFTSSLFDTNNSSNNTTVDIQYVNNITNDNSTYNFSLFEIKPNIDDRDYIFAKYGKYVYLDKNGYHVRNTINYKTHDYYELNNNISGSAVFTSSYFTVQTVGSGSGLLTNQITGSKMLKDIYSGSMGSGYSQRHLSKFVKIGTRVKQLAVNVTNYKTTNGVRLKTAGEITYYTYTKGQNNSSTTVNRKGLPNGSSPVITIPGFLSVDIESDNFPLYGTLTGSIGQPDSLFVRQPLTCSTCTSASLNTYIMNL